MKKKVLFVCVHNSARSQMAEAFLNNCCPEVFEAKSAGLEPGKLNPFVVESMKEIGIDISQNSTKTVEDIFRQNRQFDYLITVCDEANAERCPVVPGVSSKLHWGFSDPSMLVGTAEAKLDGTRKIRDKIRTQINNWCKEICKSSKHAV